MNQTVHTLIMWSHAALGFVGVLGGVLALSVVKGSRLHVRGGKVFGWCMAFAATSALLMMFHEVLPLAIVLSLTELYLLASGLLAFNRRTRNFITWHRLLMILPAALCAYAAMQFVRFNLGPGPFFIGPLVLTIMFGFLFIEDMRLLKSAPSNPNFWIRRHLLRMILAFTVAIMAVVRIGIRFGLSLEITVVVPLFIAAIAIAWTYRKYPLAPPVRAGEPA